MSRNSIKNFFVILPLLLVNIQQFQKLELRVKTLFNKDLITDSLQNSSFNTTNNKSSHTKLPGKRSSSYYKGKRGARRGFQLGPLLIFGILAFMMVVITITVLLIRIIF